MYVPDAEPSPEPPAEPPAPPVPLIVEIVAVPEETLDVPPEDALPIQLQAEASLIPPPPPPITDIFNAVTPVGIVNVPLEVKYCAFAIHNN